MNVGGVFQVAALQTSWRDTAVEVDWWNVLQWKQVREYLIVNKVL